MARPPRLDLPNIPQHIVQRGNDRGPCFFDDRGRRLYLDLLRDAAGDADVSVHAYVLMTNHVHLLATPRGVGAISALMQAIGRRYVQWLNKRRSRTGTLFEGRFKASLVQSERYLLSCYRYIELNPVRAGLAADPAEYRWSSYQCNALGKSECLITPHPHFLDLADSPAERQRLYGAFVAEGLAASEHKEIRSHVQQGRALGNPDFQAWVESATGQRARLTARGRPRKKMDPTPFPPPENGSDPFLG